VVSGEDISNIFIKKEGKNYDGYQPNGILKFRIHY
jgi:hypothetical protein